MSATFIVLPQKINITQLRMQVKPLNNIVWHIRKENSCIPLKYVAPFLKIFKAHFLFVADI